MADAIGINVAGVWKADPLPKINVSGVWKTCDQVSINVSGVWKPTMATGPVVDIKANGRTNYRFDSTCYAGERFYTTGVEYEITATNGNVSMGNWLTSGTASEVWVMYTRTGGNQTVFSGKANNTRYQISSNQTFRLVALSGQYKTITGYFRMYDAASGGNLLDTGGSHSFIAESEGGGGCPLCCFTPDTLVSMPSGLDVPISSVREGDMIMGPEGEQEVEAIEIRYDMPVFQLTFEDGRTVSVTPDHPFHTERGAASVSQYDGYKDLPSVEKLRVGDRVFTYDGSWLRLTKMDFVRKEPIVYTFANSLFYANGLLVY